MKLSLQKSELLAILSAHLGHTVTDITITKVPSTVARDLTAKVARDLCISGELDQTRINHPNNKIPAIKSLRSHVSGMGLAEAKWAVENWGEWIAFTKDNRRVPKIEFLGGGWNGPVTLS